MKKLMKCIMVALCLAVAVAFAMGAQTTNVQAKKKVTYKLKKGTLTFKGKGDMPKKIKVKKSKVKKVVIKKGVKSISNNAFKGFKKLTKVSIPKTVKKIGVSAFEETAIKKLTIPSGTKKLGVKFINYCKKLDYVTLPGDFVIVDKKGNANKNRGASYGTDLDTVTFNTNLDYNACAYFSTYNFQTYANDAKFKTFDGVLYTKDGTGIVRVPSARDTIVLKDGCTDFNTMAVTYNASEQIGTVCQDLIRVTLPQTVVRVNDDAYFDGVTAVDHRRNMDIVFNNTKLEIPQIVKLKNTFNISAETLKKKLPTRITTSGDNYVGDGKYLIQGSSNATTEVPAGITTICEEAYSGAGVQKVILPSSVTTIDNRAFENTYLKTINLDNVKKIGTAAFKGTQFTSVALPAAITAVPDYAFYDCQDLTEVTFAGDLKSVGAFSFMGTRLNLQDFLNANTKLETIGESAFELVGYTNLTIPANIKTVGPLAFYETNNVKFVTIAGNTAGFDTRTFGEQSGVTLQFSQGITQAWVANDHDYYQSGKKMKFHAWWDKVSEVNGYEIWLAKNKTLTKGVKKYTAKYNEKSFSVSLTKKNAKGLTYYGIRPYKTVNGKKVYGKWTIKAL